MKRICCPFIALLMALSLLSACQPTPEVEPVAQKDSEALIEQVEVAEEGVADMAKAPESRHITRELAEVSQKTGIDITIDADVVLPETDAIPVARVQNGELDMSVLENIWKILGNGSGMLEDFPRSYYEGQARMWMEFRENGVLDKYSSFEEMDAAIEELLAEAATKPAEPVFSPESPMETVVESVTEDGTPIKYIPIFYGWSDQETVYEMQLSTLGPISFYATLMKAIYGMNIILLIRSTYICPRSSAESSGYNCRSGRSRMRRPMPSNCLPTSGSRILPAWSRALRR